MGEVGCVGQWLGRSLAGHLCHHIIVTALLAFSSIGCPVKCADGILFKPLDIL